MLKNTIYQLLGKVEWDIREAYTGGAVDVFINHNGKFYNLLRGLKDKLYYYDVNSLYPYTMGTLGMPIGKPIAFEGNIEDCWIAENTSGAVIEHEYVYFFYCKITSPEFLNHPILQRRIKTKDGIRTIAGLGSWTGWISSYEYFTALRHGYEIEVIKGYKFKKGNIFKEYVEKLYQIRMTYSKSDPMNLIAKLLMNSLYGKFGMKSESNGVEVYNSNVPLEMEALDAHLARMGESVSDILKAGDHYVIQTKEVHYRFDDKEDLYHGIDVNVAIAATVTAGARCLMSQVKNCEGMNIYYTDTDSVITNKPLAPELVGDKLGQFKLECEITEAVFLAPKVYGIRTTEGEEIIKVKGLTKSAVSKVTIKMLEALLVEGAKEKIDQIKWQKDPFNGTINLLETCYNLHATSTKRMPVYRQALDRNNNYIRPILTITKPFNYEDIQSNSIAKSIQYIKEVVKEELPK